MKTKRWINMLDDYIDDMAWWQWALLGYVAGYNCCWLLLVAIS